MSFGTHGLRSWNSPYRHKISFSPGNGHQIITRIDFEQTRRCLAFPVVQRIHPEGGPGRPQQTAPRDNYSPQIDHSAFHGDSNCPSSACTRTIRGNSSPSYVWFKCLIKWSCWIRKRTSFPDLTLFQCYSNSGEGRGWQRAAQLWGSLWRFSSSQRTALFFGAHLDRAFSGGEYPLTLAWRRAGGTQGGNSSLKRL